MRRALFYIVFTIPVLLNAQEFDLAEFFNTTLTDLPETEQFDQIAFQANELYDVDMNASAVLIDSLKAYAQRMDLNAQRQLNYNTVLADVYIAAGELKLAKQYVSKLFSELNQLNVEVQEGRAELNIYGILASYAYSQSSLDSALYYHNKQLNLALSLGDTLTVMEAYNGTGTIYETLGVYDLAIENLFEVVKIAEKLNDKKRIITSYNNLGLIHQENENYEIAREYLLKELPLIEEVGWESEKGYVYGNLAYNYFYVGQYPKALEYALMSQKSFEKFGFQAELTLLNTLLGRTYVALGQIELGDQHLDMALNMANPEEFVEAYIEVLFGKSQVAKAARNYPMVEAKLLEAKQISKAHDLNKLRLTTMELLVDYYEERNVYAKAFKTQKALSVLRDSIFNERKNFQISDLQTRYEVAKKEEAIAQGSLDLEKQKVRTKTTILGLILVLVLTGLISFFYLRIKRAKNQLKLQNEVISHQNKELDTLNTTKDKFFSIIAHDLRSPMIGLQGVGQKLDYFIKKGKQEKLLEMGDQIDRSIDQLNHLLNNLLNWAATETGGIPHNPEMLELKPLVEENINLYQSLANTKNIKINSQVSGEWVYADLNTLSTIVRNVLSNAVKFTKLQGEIRVASAQKEGFVVITISDQGEGMEQERISELFADTGQKSTLGSEGEQGFGLGLKLCKEFVKMNQGTIEVTSKVGQGTSFHISLPSKA